MRKQMKLTGRALSIAQDLFTVGMNANKAIQAVSERADKEVADIQTRSHGTSVQLMDELFAEVRLPADSKGDWGLDLRYVEEHGFAVLIPQLTEAEQAEVQAAGAQGEAAAGLN